MQQCRLSNADGNKLEENIVICRANELRDCAIADNFACSQRLESILMSVASKNIQRSSKQALRVVINLIFILNYILYYLKQGKMSPRSKASFCKMSPRCKASFLLSTFFSK